MKEIATCQTCNKKVVIESWFHGQGTKVEKCINCEVENNDNATFMGGISLSLVALSLCLTFNIGIVLPITSIITFSILIGLNSIMTKAFNTELMVLNYSHDFKYDISTVARGVENERRNNTRS